MAQREVILLSGGTSVATWPSWWHVQSHPTDVSVICAAGTDFTVKRILFSVSLADLDHYVGRPGWP